jgi:hypothetical protein
LLHPRHRLSEGGGLWARRLKEPGPPGRVDLERIKDQGRKLLRTLGNPGIHRPIAYIFLSVRRPGPRSCLAPACPIRTSAESWFWTRFYLS